MDVLQCFPPAQYKDQSYVFERERTQEEIGAERKADSLLTGA